MNGERGGGISNTNSAPVKFQITLITTARFRGGISVETKKVWPKIPGAQEPRNHPTSTEPSVDGDSHEVKMTGFAR